MGGPQAILERAGVVRPAVDEPEFREALQELRCRRDVNVDGPRDLARQMPVPVAERSEDRDAVLAGEEQNCLPECLLVHRDEPQAAARRGRRSLFIVELGGLKGCPGILSLDYLGKERTNSGGHAPSRVLRWQCRNSTPPRPSIELVSERMLSKVEVWVPDSGPLRPSRPIDSRPLRPRPGARDTRCVTRDLRKPALSERGRSKSAWDRRSSSTCRAGSSTRSKSRGSSSTAARSRLR